jgi:hypothetical protein
MKSKKVYILIGLLCGLFILMKVFGTQRSLDVKLYYTGDQARALLSGFGEQETKAYFLNEIFDLFFIFCYSSLFYIGLRRCFPTHRWIWTMAFVPGLFDYVETLMILYALEAKGPHLFFDWLGIATFLKWTTGAAVVGLIGAQYIRVKNPT